MDGSWYLMMSSYWSVSLHVCLYSIIEQTDASLTGVSMPEWAAGGSWILPTVTPNTCEYKNLLCVWLSNQRLHQKRNNLYITTFWKCTIKQTSICLLILEVKNCALKIQCLHVPAAAAAPAQLWYSCQELVFRVNAQWKHTNPLVMMERISV